MGIDPKWLAGIVTEDEYGEPETWEFHFKRPTTRAMLAFVKAQTAEGDAGKVELILEALDGIVAG